MTSGRTSQASRCADHVLDKAVAVARSRDADLEDVVGTHFPGRGLDNRDLELVEPRTSLEGDEHVRVEQRAADLDEVVRR